MDTVNSSFPSFHYLHRCYDSKAGSTSGIVFFMAHILLLLPVSLLVLFLGLQRWRQRSISPTCHSDVFTFHGAAMELIMQLGAAFYSCGRYLGVTHLTTLGFYATSNFYFGPISFNVLTCVERYLAVVRPVTYLRLRQSGGVKVRNIGIGCAWTLYFAWFGFQALYVPQLPYFPLFSLLVFSLVVVSFCSVSILCVLNRPGPGDKGGNRERVDKSKQRAFHTIAAITVVLWLLFLGLICCVAVDNGIPLSNDDSCAALGATTWFTLPSSFILPLLFLHRAGKLASLPCSSS